VRAKELRERNEEELLRLKEDAVDSIFQARLKNATHQLDDSSVIKRSRREVARINTILSERDHNIDGTAATGEEEE